MKKLKSIERKLVARIAELEREQERLEVDIRKSKDQESARRDKIKELGDKIKEIEVIVRNHRSHITSEDKRIREVIGKNSEVKKQLDEEDKRLKDEADKLIRCNQIAKDQRITFEAIKKEFLGDKKRRDEELIAFKEREAEHKRKALLLASDQVAFERRVIAQDDEWLEIENIKNDYEEKDLLAKASIGVYKWKLLTLNDEQAAIKIRNEAIDKREFAVREKESETESIKNFVVKMRDDFDRREKDIEAREIAFAKKEESTQIKKSLGIGG